MPAESPWSQLRGPWRPFEASWEAWSPLGGPARSWGGGGERETERQIKSMRVGESKAENSSEMK